MDVPRPCQYGQGLASGGAADTAPAAGPSKEGDSTPLNGAGEETQGRPQRFQRIWVSDEGEGKGKPGLSVHVVAELADLKAHKTLWMQLTLQPETRSKGGDMVPAGPVKPLFVKVDDPTRRNFQLVVGCDQLPKLPPEGGAYRAWVSILGSEKQPLDKSGDFLIPAPCQVAVKTR